jgi:hypothetical protein
MSYDNLSSVSQNVLKYYQQLTGEERRIPHDEIVILLDIRAGKKVYFFYWIESNLTSIRKIVFMIALLIFSSSQ